MEDTPMSTTRSFNDFDMFDMEEPLEYDIE